MLEVCLAIRAEKRAWFVLADGGSRVLMMACVFVLVWGRILENTPLSKWGLIVLIGVLFIQAMLRSFNYMNWISLYHPTDLKSVVLSENLLLLGNQKLLVSGLKSLVIESDGYTGKLAGRSTHTGKGKLTFVHKADSSEERHLITVDSLTELNKLRTLSEAWRSQGIVVFVMD